MANASNTGAPNPFFLAADNKQAALLGLLRAEPSLAKIQDERGYSLLHAAASYNHVELLRRLARDFSVDVDGLRDEDGETALFATETVAAAKVLVEELGADVRIRNHDGLTAAEKMEDEGESLVVAAYLRDVLRRVYGGGDEEDEGDGGEGHDDARAPTNHAPISSGSTRTAREPSIKAREPNDNDDIIISRPPPIPKDLSIDLTTTTIQEQPLPEISHVPRGALAEGVDPTGGAQEAQVVDPEFKRRIDELASRGDISDEAGQAELRSLVEKAVREHVTGSAATATVYPSDEGGDVGQGDRDGDGDGNEGLEAGPRRRRLA